MTLSLKALAIPALWLSGFLLSFYVLPVPDVFQTAMVVSLAVLALAATFFFKKTDFKYNSVTVLVLCLWGLAAVSVSFSEVQFISLIYFFFFSLFPLSFLLFGMERGKLALKVVRGILLALGVAALVQFFAMPEMLKFGGTHWPFADNNTLGALLAVGIVLFFGESLRGGQSQTINLVAAIILFAAMLTTEGRAIALAFAGVLIVFLLLARPVSKKTVGIFLAGAVLLLCTMKQSDLSIYHWFGEGQKTIQSFVDAPADAPDKLTGSRFMIWKSAVQIFTEHPVTGTGIGTFFLYYPEVRNPLDDSAGYMAHNDLIQFGVEMGFLSPLLAMAIVLLMAFMTFRKLRHLGDANERLNLLIPFCAFILIVGHSLVNFNFYILPTLMVSGLILATWNAQFATREITARENKLLRDAGIVCASILFLFGVWSVSISEFKVSEALERLGHEDAAGFAASVETADKFGFGMNGRAYLQAGVFADITGDDVKALELFDKAEAVNPRMAQIYLERARVLLKTDKAKALGAAEQGLKIDPSSISLRMMVADSLEAEGRREEAYTVLKAGMVGIMRSPDSRAYYQRVASLAIEFNDFETNRQALLHYRVK